MQAKIIHYGPWQIPIRCEHALCPDGKRRNVKITRDADTYWTLPAKLSYRGTSVSGWITSLEHYTCQECGADWLGNHEFKCHSCLSTNTTFRTDYEFHAGGKHADIFGEGK